MSKRAVASAVEPADETVILDRTWLGRQSWYRERIVVRSQGRRVRYFIKSDAYDFQSYAKVSIWRDDEWQTIHQIPGERMKTKASYVDPLVQPTAFDDDIAELRRVATAVTGEELDRE